MRYRSQRDDDADLRSKLRELAQQRRRFGYRRLHILLRREGVVIKTQVALWGKNLSNVCYANYGLNLGNIFASANM